VNASELISYASLLLNLQPAPFKSPLQCFLILVKYPTRVGKSNFSLILLRFSMAYFS
jgi:hypothetical protein